MECLNSLVYIVVVEVHTKSITLTARQSVNVHRRCRRHRHRRSWDIAAQVRSHKRTSIIVRRAIASCAFYLLDRLPTCACVRTVRTRAFLATNLNKKELVTVSSQWYRSDLTVLRDTTYLPGKLHFGQAAQTQLVHLYHSILLTLET